MQKTKTKSIYSRVTKDLLKVLPERHQDILVHRFGLKGESPETLESIGRSYAITRERVRQIEKDGLEHIRKSKALENFSEIIEELKQHIDRYGGIRKEMDLFDDLGLDSSLHPQIHFLLTLSPVPQRLSEDKRFYARWLTNEDSHDLLDNFINLVTSYLEKEHNPQEAEAFLACAREYMTSISGELLENHVLESFLGLSKKICRGCFGHYGLQHWPEINPKGVRDKAYIVLKQENRPFHFREITDFINKTAFSRIYTSKRGSASVAEAKEKRANSQTVHNELIKDDRFVLIGRGIYALQEWGYEPGVVKDVIARLLRKNGSMTAPEIVKAVLAQRLVKENTILFNLQNRDIFEKLPDGKYRLVG